MGGAAPRLWPDMSIHFRIPGAHPEEDVWESADAESFVKVTDDEGNLWFVADLSDTADAYLIQQMPI